MDDCIPKNPETLLQELASRPGLYVQPPPSKDVEKYEDRNRQESFLILTVAVMGRAGFHHGWYEPMF